VGEKPNAAVEEELPNPIVLRCKKGRQLRGGGGGVRGEKEKKKIKVDKK